MPAITPAAQRVYEFLKANKEAKEIDILRVVQKEIDGALRSERANSEGLRVELNRSMDERNDMQRRFNEESMRLVSQAEAAAAEVQRLQAELEQARAVAAAQPAEEPPPETIDGGA